MIQSGAMMCSAIRWRAAAGVWAELANKGLRVIRNTRTIEAVWIAGSKGNE